MDENGTVVSLYLTEGRFVHFLTDNMNIKETTLDRKGTFQAIQVTTWQRGPPKANLLEGIKFSNTGTIHIPDVMNDIIPALNSGRTTEGPYNEGWLAGSHNLWMNAHWRRKLMRLTRHSQLVNLLRNQCLLGLQPKCQHSQPRANISGLPTHNTGSCM